MAELKKDDKQLFAFWLVENLLPHDEGGDEQDPISDSQFYFSLTFAAVCVVVASILLRGCTPW